MKLAPAFCLLFWIGLSMLSGAAEHKVKIVTTFAPAYCFAVNIAGEHAEVANLLPQHASLHDYSLVPADLKKLNSAGILVLNGAGLETWFEKALKGVQARPNVTVVRLADNLDKDLIPSELAEHHHGHKHDHGQFNPHLWLDPILAEASVTNILQALVSRDPANTISYQKNAADFLERLQKLHREYQQQTASVKNTAFLTYHNAFAYLARRYQLNLVGVVEEVPEVPPSPRELGALYKMIKTKSVKALFTEPGGRTRLAQQIAREAKITLGELDPFETGELSPDAYEKVMRRNLTNLLQVLSR